MPRTSASYLKDYYYQRKAEDPLYYRLNARRKYYRRKLKSLPEDAVEERSRVSGIADDLDRQMKALTADRIDGRKSRKRTDVENDLKTDTATEPNSTD